MTAAAFGVRAACVVLAPPDGAPLARVTLDDHDPTFHVAYIQSVTRTPVDERYRVDGARIVETEIRFVEHGPGLPTAPDAGGTFERRDGQFIVRGDRTLGTIVMRVHADQRPALIAGAQRIDLAQWGNRALSLKALAGSCSGTRAGSP